MAGNEVETIWATSPQVSPGSGWPMPANHAYVVPKGMATVRYQRGMARPAAEVYLERLRAMGVVGVAVTDDAEPSVREAAAKIGIGVSGGASTPERRGPGRPRKNPL